MSTTTPERIVTAMAELMRRQGYSATSVKQVADAAHAPMGSLYHHFPEGKQQIAAAALRTSGAAYIQLLPLLMDAHDDLREAVPASFAAAAEQIAETDWINMCPVGTVAGEVSESEPMLREVAAEVMTSWIDQGVDYFVRRGLTAIDARDLMLAILGLLEGAFILSRTLRSAEPLHAAARAASARLDAVLSDTPAGTSARRSAPLMT
jgi:AcrR family transcriptional regulator